MGWILQEHQPIRLPLTATATRMSQLAIQAACEFNAGACAAASTSSDCSAVTDMGECSGFSNCCVDYAVPSSCKDDGQCTYTDVPTACNTHSDCSNRREMCVRRWIGRR